MSQFGSTKIEEDMEEKKRWTAVASITEITNEAGMALATRNLMKSQIKSIIRGIVFLSNSVPKANTSTKPFLGFLTTRTSSLMKISKMRILTMSWMRFVKLKCKVSLI